MLFETLLRRSLASFTARQAAAIEQATKKGEPLPQLVVCLVKRGGEVRTERRRVRDEALSRVATDQWGWLVPLKKIEEWTADPKLTRVIYDPERGVLYRPRDGVSWDMLLHPLPTA